MGPFAWIVASSRGRVFLALSLLLAGLSVALAALGEPLVTGAAPLGIVSFEFVGSAERAERLLASWTPATRETAMLVLGLDYLYLCVYPAWFALACEGLGRRVGGGFGRLGTAVAWGVLPAGLLDAVENLGLIRLLVAGPDDAWAALAWGCAALKFALVILAAAYVLVGAARVAARRLAGPASGRS